MFRQNLRKFKNGLEILSEKNIQIQGKIPKFLKNMNLPSQFRFFLNSSISNFDIFLDLENKLTTLKKVDNENKFVCRLYEKFIQVTLCFNSQCGVYEGVLELPVGPVAFKVTNSSEFYSLLKQHDIKAQKIHIQGAQREPYRLN